MRPREPEKLTGSLSLTLQWMLATAGALTLAAVVMEILLASTVGSLTLPIHLLAAAAVGLPVGAAQWIVLRRLVPDPGRRRVGAGHHRGVGGLRSRRFVRAALAARLDRSCRSSADVDRRASQY